MSLLRFSLISIGGFWTNSFSWYLLLLKLVGGLRMYIGVTIKRYRALKEVGKIKMSVGIITYYQLIQVCQVNMFSYFPILFSFTFLNPHMNMLECLWYIGEKFLFVVTVVLLGEIFQALFNSTWYFLFNLHIVHVLAKIC